MNQKQIKDYILKYKGTHPKKSIEDSLTKVGVSIDDINRIYGQVDKKYHKPSHNNSRNTGFIVLIVLVIFFGVSMLIVGALIFSFVDFGSVLPNKIDLSGNLRADSSQSLVTQNEMILVLTYVGVKPSYIDLVEAEISLISNGNCNFVSIENANSGLSATSTETSDTVSFINGQIAVIKLNCNGFEVDDMVEGELYIPVKSSKTNLSIPSSGNFRLTVME